MSYQPPYDSLPAPTDAAEAKRRADFFRRRDPFPNIKPALLDAKDFLGYLRVTGMLFPYSTSEDRLKPASYEARTKSFIWWDDSEQKRMIKVEPNKKYVLPANSITFALIESTIRLPDYIALRFNLRIKHVHRGLLLGTGPLVDPGFSGDLLIPVHNLTSDDYEIDGSEGLIWIEFTKTSRKLEEAEPKVELEEHKKEVPSETYFERASGNNPIRSSIPHVVKDARQAEKAARKAKATVQLFAGIGILATAGVVITTAFALHSYFGQMSANVIASNSLAGAVGKDANQASTEAKQALEHIDDLQKALTAATRRIDGLEAQIKQQADEIEQLRKRK